MSLLLIAENRDPASWKEAFLREDAGINVEIWPEVQNPEKVQFAVVWRHPPHSLSQFPNLKTVSSLGAGVDHILSDETLPNELRICRVVDENLSNQMKRYMLTAVLNYQLNTFPYYRQKQEGKWRPLVKKSPSDFTVGVMGLGKIGLPTAEYLAAFGYDVAGWSNSLKETDAVRTFTGAEALDSFLEITNVLICLLPLTPQTKGILELELFKKLKQPSYLINAGRGAHLVEEDLIYALDKVLLEGAQLDVFSEEPLPEKHHFWNREKIVITPHVSAETDPKAVASQIVENYKRTLSGLPLKNEVGKERQY